MKRTWENLKIDLYFTANDIRALLLDRKCRKETLAYYRPLRLHTAYFEFARPDSGIADDEMSTVIRDFTAAGIATAGAIIPSKNYRPLCYNDPDHLQSLRQQTLRVAGLFNELIIDDWLFTVCTCPRCTKAAGTRSWAEYRCGILPAMADRYIIQPAREINPKVKIIVKFPNWWEGYHHNGYALKEQASQFDAFCQGIETRSLAAHNQHLPAYTGYFLQRWTEKLAPKKRASCWYDNWDMGNHLAEYIAQPVQGVLGGSRELVVWSAGTHFKTHPWTSAYRALRDHLPQLDRLAGLVPSAAGGIPTFIPYGSDGEYNITGYLGMMGIPIDPTPVFPTKEQCCILTLHSAKDRSLAAKTIARLKSGKDVFMTWRLFDALKSTQLGRALQVIDTQGTVCPRDLRLTNRIGGKFSSTTLPAGGAFTFRKIRLTTWPYANSVAAVIDDGDYGVLMSVKFLNGTITVLNVPEDSSTLLKLPAEALNAIRRVFSAQLNFCLEAPAKVACYLFKPDMIVLYNMNDEKAEASLVFDASTMKNHWQEINDRIAVRSTVVDEKRRFTLTLLPGKLALLKKRS